MGVRDIANDWPDAERGNSEANGSHVHSKCCEHPVRDEDIENTFNPLYLVFCTDLFFIQWWYLYSVLTYL